MQLSGRIVSAVIAETNNEVSSNGRVIKHLQGISHFQ